MSRYSGKWQLSVTNEATGRVMDVRFYNSRWRAKLAEWLWGFPNGRKAKTAIAKFEPTTMTFSAPK